MMGRRKRPITIVSTAVCMHRSNGSDIHDEGWSRRRHEEMKMIAAEGLSTTAGPRNVCDHDAPVCDVLGGTSRDVLFGAPPSKCEDEHFTRSRHTEADGIRE